MGGKPASTSSEMRYDWLTDRWVIMAPNRMHRPNSFRPSPIDHQGVGSCPFCAGNEDQTPREVATYSLADDSNAAWAVRVIPNKYPAVEQRSKGWPTLHSATLGPLTRCIDLYQRRSLAGGHEVIVESPKHCVSLSQLSLAEVELVFRAYRDRLQYWLCERQAPYAVVFKNSGLDAGASLAHVHSQLIATDIVPADVFRVNARMQQFLDTESECLFCRVIQAELAAEIRVVDQSQHFLAYCPFASRLPASITVLPTQHLARFEAVEDDCLKELARFIYRLVRRIELCYPDTAYNYVIHTASPESSNERAFHWRIEVFPRLTKVAGFEWGSECYINPILPEQAAARLREARDIVPGD